MKVKELTTPTEYTPGPWHVDSGHIKDANGYALARVPYPLGGPEDHANSLLMAAAPELKDAIHVLLLGLMQARDELAKLAEDPATDAALRRKYKLVIEDFDIAEADAYAVIAKTEVMPWKNRK